MTTLELEIELDDPVYEQMYEELTEQTETSVDEILASNAQPTIEELLHRLYQEAKE